MAIVEDGDAIVIDAETSRIDVTLSEEEIAARLERWQPPPPRYTRGALAKFAKAAASASEGAVTDKYL